MDVRITTTCRTGSVLGPVLQGEIARFKSYIEKRIVKALNLT